MLLSFFRVTEQLKHVRTKADEAIRKDFTGECFFKMQANLVSGSPKTAAEMWVQVSVICEKCVSSAAIWHLGRQDGVGRERGSRGLSINTGTPGLRSTGNKAGRGLSISIRTPGALQHTSQ